jgi:hypothetical protein
MKTAFGARKVALGHQSGLPTERRIFPGGGKAAECNTTMVWKWLMVGSPMQ